jgi:hypothetical protein
MYVLPAVMTPETMPPALAAGMGPVAQAFFVATYNALTAAMVPLGMALERAGYAMYSAGFCRQADGTWTRPETWEADMAECAKWYEPSGVMRSDATVARAGKVLSAANAETLRKVCRGMDEHMGALAGLLESCGYGMDAEEMVQESTNTAEIPIRVQRSEITGGSVTTWISPSIGADGKPVFDAHGTNFSTEILTRAVDEAAIEGRFIGMDDEHGNPIDGRWTQLIVVTDEVARAIQSQPLKRGLLGKGVVWSEELRSDLKSGKKKGASIEGMARFVKA